MGSLGICHPDDITFCKNTQFLPKGNNFKLISLLFLTSFKAEGRGQQLDIHNQARSCWEGESNVSLFPGK